MLFSVHTFTPTFGGEDRHWDAGVLWNRDPRMAVPLIEFLRRHEGLNIGDNEPYSGAEIAYTLNLHAGAAGLANAAIEVRQDHCETERQLHHWADILADALGQLLAMGNLHRIEQILMATSPSRSRSGSRRSICSSICETREVAADPPPEMLAECERGSPIWSSPSS